MYMMSAKGGAVCCFLTKFIHIIIMSTVRHKTSKVNKSLCVGIITIPHLKKVKYGTSHIMKAYVDWFEERGVHVIPIPYDTTEHQMYFSMINGLVIPGGETSFIMKNKTFIATVTQFLELSLQQNEYFPIWGTCFGFELLIFLIGNFDKLKQYNAHGFYPLRITPAGHESRMFKSFPPQYLHYLENNKSCNNNHEFGISPNDFTANEHLRRFYNVLATSVADNGKDYVAAIEAKHYPIYGVQWHPERQKTTGHFVDFFISELKKNKHKCITRAYLRSLIAPHKCSQYPEHKNQMCYFF